MVKKNYLEDDLAQLETIAKQLESGTENLEDSVALFKKSVVLYDKCKKQLEQLQLEITKISRDSGEDNAGNIQ